jgi:hypothetical protein
VYSQQVGATPGSRLLCWTKSFDLCSDKLKTKIKIKYK